MAERAQVSSIESIEAFRSRLVLYSTKSRAALEEVLDEVRRTRVWLESSQRSHWETECRRRKRALEDAEQELFSAKLSQIRTQTAAHILAVERARRALRQAEEKRDAVKRWSREFEIRAESLAREVEPLLTHIMTDVSKAVVYLGNIVRTLQTYASGVSGPETGAAPAEAREPEGLGATDQSPGRKEG